MIYFAILVTYMFYAVNSPNFDVKSIILFPNFGQGPFPKIAGNSPDCIGFIHIIFMPLATLDSHIGPQADMATPVPI